MTAADKIAEARDDLTETIETTLDGYLAEDLTEDDRMELRDLIRRDISAALADAQAQEIARLKSENERLSKMLQPEWFYPFDGCDGESTYDSITELLDEHYFWDRPKTGHHVVKVEAVTTLPSIWTAVRFNCICADPDECECDNDMIVTEHASEAEARAALGETP